MHNPKIYPQILLNEAFYTLRQLAHLGAVQHAVWVLRIQTNRNI